MRPTGSKNLDGEKLRGLRYCCFNAIHDDSSQFPQRFLCTVVVTFQAGRIFTTARRGVFCKLRRSIRRYSPNGLAAGVLLSVGALVGDLFRYSYFVRVSLLIIPDLSFSTKPHVGFELRVGSVDIT